MNFEQFDSRVKASYENKINYTRKIIRKAYNEFRKKLSVSCSFGKDSVVVLYFAREVDPDIPVLWANTGVEFPEVIKFARKLTKEWGLNLIEVKPIKTFWQCVREYGFPWPRKVKMKNRYKAPGTPRCCYWMKEKPIKEKIHELGLEATMTGLTWDESYNRKWSLIRNGDWFFSKKRKYWFIHPIAYWNTFEVWMFIEENDIPFCPIYEKIERIGCRTCTAHFGWEKQMAQVSPKLYNYIMKKMRELGDPRAMYLISDFI